MLLKAAVVQTRTLFYVMLHYFKYLNKLKVNLITLIWSGSKLFSHIPRHQARLTNLKSRNLRFLTAACVAYTRFYTTPCIG